MINEYWITFFLAVAPITEGRGAVAYGVAQNLNIPFVFAIAVLANILTIPPIFFILKEARFMRFAHRILGKKVSKIIVKNKKRFDIYQELALFLFVAIPFPFTGSWTATFAATVLDLNKPKSFAVMSIGVLVSTLIALFISVGAISLA